MTTFFTTAPYCVLRSDEPTHILVTYFVCISHQVPVYLSNNYFIGAWLPPGGEQQCIHARQQENLISDQDSFKTNHNVPQCAFYAVRLCCPLSVVYNLE